MRSRKKVARSSTAALRNNRKIKVPARFSGVGYGPRPRAVGPRAWRRRLLCVTISKAHETKTMTGQGEDQGEPALLPQGRKLFTAFAGQQKQQLCFKYVLITTKTPENKGNSFTNLPF